MEFEKMLTKGALKSLKNNENIEGPIMQVIGIKKSQKRDNCNCLIISDGENINYVEISPIINSMVSTGKLTKFSFIKINDYMTNNVIGPPKEPYQTIFFLDLVVIVPGSIVHKTIGLSQPILETKVSDQTAQVNEECSELDKKQELVWRSLIERGLHSEILTKGALQYIMNNVEVKYPIMQVLRVTPFRKTVSNIDRYYLYISDGEHYFGPIFLTPHLNSLITNGYLRKSSVIYIKSYVFSTVTESFKRNSQAIILLDLVCLFVCPDKIIGNPIPIKKNSGCEPTVEMDTLEPPTAHDLEMENLLQNFNTLEIV